jgi:hypothetical protein
MEKYNGAAICNLCYIEKSFVRCVWEAERKYWGLAEKLNSKKKEAAAAKEKAFLNHIEKLEQQTETLSLPGSVEPQHLDIVGLGTQLPGSRRVRY